MKKLRRSPSRLVWVVATNSAAILLLLLNTIRAFNEHKMLYQAMRTATPPFGYVHEIFSDVWTLAIVGTLAAGIVAESLRSTWSLILNLGPFALCLAISCWQMIGLAKDKTPSDVSPELVVLLLVIPLAVVVAVSAAFYIVAFRHREAADVGANVGVALHSESQISDIQSPEAQPK